MLINLRSDVFDFSYIVYENNVRGDETAHLTAEQTWSTEIDDLIAAGGDAIYETDMWLAVGFDFDAWVGTYSKKYPKAYIIQLDSCPGFVYDEGFGATPNLLCAVFKEDEVSFAAGALAGLSTTTKTVGGVFGAPFTPLLKFSTGFAKGVTYVCPDCKVESAFVHSFVEPDLGNAMAKFYVEEKGADVIFAAAGGTGFGAIKYSMTAGVKTIGVDSDQFHSDYGGDFNPEDLKYLLSSAMKRLDTVINYVVMDFIKESRITGLFSFDYSNDGVGLAPCHLACEDISAESQRKITAIEKQLAVQLLSTGAAPLREAEPDVAFFGHGSEMRSYANAPSSRIDAASAYIDGDFDTFVMFGGASGDNSESLLADLWEYDVIGQTWREVSRAGILNARGFLVAGADGFSTPAGRVGAAMASLSGISSYGCCGDNGNVFMFGGKGEDHDDGGAATLLEDAWVFTRDQPWWPASPQWTKLPAVTTTKPEARSSHAMATQKGTSNTFMFGGKNKFQYLNDIWVSLPNPPHITLATPNTKI